MPNERQIRLRGQLKHLDALDDEKLELLYNMATQYRYKGLEKLGFEKPNLPQITQLKGFIKELRTWIGVNQTRFARMTNSTQHTVSKWETLEGFLPIRKHWDYILELYKQSYQRQIGRKN